MHAFELIRSREVVRRCALGLVLVAIYVALSWVSSLHQYKGLLIRPWNPGLGFMFALIVLGGPWLGIVLFVSSVTTGIIVRHGILGFPGMIGVAAIISVVYTGAAVITHRNFHIDVGLKRLRDISILIGAGIVATAAVTVLVVALLAALRRLGPADIVPAVVRLFVGNLIGISVMAPLVLRLAWRWRERSLGALLSLGPELAAYTGLIVAMLWVILSIEELNEYKFFYLLFLPVIAAAVRHGLDGACISLAATQFGLVAMLRYHAYDATAFTEFQILMFVLTATALVVGSIVAERQEIDRTARQAEARLKEKEAEATRAARFNLLSGMASSLAHEVSQPMTAARALARSVQQILRTPSVDLPRAEGNLANLIAQIDHASGIVRRTRDFLSRTHPHASTLDIRIVIDDALALIHPEAAARHIDIALELADDLPMIHGDRVQLQQVILNLIRNGIDSIVEAFPATGRIRVSAQRSNGQILIGVADTGTGISEEIGDRLFEPLTTSKSDGLGLGLSICASIIEAHGGKIWLESSRPGATEFRFSLPAASERQMAS